jgi:hypothetical protein
MRKNEEFAMNNTVKIILIAAVALVVLCSCATLGLGATGLWSFAKVVEASGATSYENTNEVAQVTAEIADFELPAGFDYPYALQVADFTMVSYLSQNKNTSLFLAQFPQGTDLNVGEMLDTIGRGVGNPRGFRYSAQMTTVEETPVMVRGQETTLTIQEGVSAEGVAFRLAIVAFEGKGGPALLVVDCNANEWNSEMVTGLISSLD